MVGSGADVTQIARAIVLLRGHRVLLDAELALLYGTTTKRLNQQVKRNAGRFPADFVFRLSANETAALNRSQIATGSQRHRDPRFPPFAFTEHGAIMAATVINSDRAVEMSVFVVRAFISLRRALAAHAELGRKVDELERRVGAHDTELAQIIATIRELMSTPEPERRGMGFLADIR
jgi:hypothetical protein